MVRGKIQMKRIENPVHRQVTFCKRRTGLLKKAKELSVLCDADIGLLILSGQSKRYELATKGTMHGMIERYMKCTGSGVSAQVEHKDNNQVTKDQLKEEISLLKHEIDSIQKELRLIYGGANGATTLSELDMLEKHFESWINQVRSSKMDIMFQEIQLLKNKEEILEAANKHLQEKIDENYGIFDMISVMSDVEYPLRMPSGLSNHHQF